MNRQQGATIYLKMLEFRMVAYIVNVYLLSTLLQVSQCRHITPGTERVDISTHRVYYIVDAMLYYHRRSPSYIHFYRKTSGAFQSVSLIGDAVVLSENACATDGTTDYSHIIIIMFARTQGEIVRPALCRYRVTIANEGMVLLLSKNVDGIQEIEPVSVTREVKRQFVCFGKVAVGILSFRQRASDESSRIHLGALSKVYAHLYGVASIYGALHLLTRNLLAWENGLWQKVYEVFTLCQSPDAYLT